MTNLINHFSLLKIIKDSVGVLMGVHYDQFYTIP